LTSAAQALERCYTQFDKYNDTANCAIAKQLTKSGGFLSPEGFYTLTGTFTADTYTLTAKPVAGKSQEDDTQCASLTLDNTGREGASGIDPRQCW
jgi:type IV pilus assembly protein PilE